MSGMGKWSMIRHFVWDVLSAVSVVLPLSRRRLADLILVASLPLWVAAVLSGPVLFKFLAPPTVLFVLWMYARSAAHAARDEDRTEGGEATLDLVAERALHAAEQIIVWQLALSVLSLPLGEFPSGLLAITVMEVAIIALYNPRPPRPSVYSRAAERLSSFASTVTAALSPAPTPIPVPTH